MEKAKNKKGIIIGIAVLTVLAAVFAAVYFLVIDKPESGDKDITVEIVHSDKTVKTVEINTDAEFLRQALEEKDIVQGTDSAATGLYVLTADGETADDTQQQWWCFTKNGEMLMTGVDSTPIKDGDKFEITFTVGW